MKKFITSFLALLTCCSLFAACNSGKKDDDSTPENSSVSSESSSESAPDSGSEETNPHLTALNAAKENLLGQLINQNVSVRADYQVLNSIYSFHAEETFAVTWSVDVTEGVTIKEGENCYIVDVDETLDEDLPYVLTATITDSDGCSVNLSFDRVVEKAPQLVPVAITEKPAENTPYKLHVYQSSLGKDLFFAGDMDGYYFLTTEDYNVAVDLFVEYIAESDNFYVYFTHAEDGKQYLGVQLSSDGAHDNIVYTATPVSEFKWNADLGTITTHLAVNKNGNAADYYLGNYSNHDTISASMLSYAATSNVGGLVTMVDKSELGDSIKVADIKEALTVATKHTLDKTVELPVSDERYPDATIAWAVEADKGATVTAEGLKLVIPETATTAKLTATITLGETTATKEFTLELGPKTVVPEDKTNAEAVLAAAFNLAEGEVLPGEGYTLTGKITTVNTAWNAEYSNITVTISVNDKAVECYRLKSGSADASVLKVGDTITVMGVIKNYNGKVEFDKDCTLEAYTAGESTDTPVVDPNLPVMDEATAYKLYLVQVTAGKTLYVDGGVSDRYLSMTETASEGADVYAEKATGGYKFYILVDGAKNYINIYMNADSKVSVNYAADSTCVYAYNADSNCWYTNVDGTDYYLGTYSTFETVSASKTSFINAENTGVSQFPAVFITKAEAESTTPPAGGEDEDPNLPVMDEATAYKFYLEQNNKGVTYYFTGAISGNFLSTTLDPAEAVDVYVEKAESGYSFYFTVEGTKTYININESGKAALATENPTVYSYNAETKIWWTTVAGTDYYLGTYNNYTTIGSSKTSFITAANTGVSQFPAAFIVATDAKAPTATEKVAFEKAKLTVANTATGAATIELPSVYTIYSDVTITWALTESTIATLENNVLTITNPDEETKVTVTATITCGDATETAVFEIVVSHKEEGTVTTTVFEFGDNGDTGHVDGNDIGTSKSYTSGAYTLTLTNASKVYAGGKDEKGNSALKLGTGKLNGSFTFTVADDVKEVIIKVAQYKANKTTVSVNGTNYDISTSSNNGEYTEIKIDTTTTKTITFATVGSTYRAMIDSITFVS